MTIRTMHSIQHALGKHFGVESICYFKRGLFVRWDYYEILVEADNVLSAIQVTVSAPRRFCNESNNKMILEKCEEVLWQAFYEIVQLKITENNSSISLTKKILSWNGAKEQGTVLYKFENVIECYNSGHAIIHHPESVGENDYLKALLTVKEIEVRNYTQVYVISDVRNKVVSCFGVHISV